MGINIADFPYADDAETRFLQVFKDHFPLRQAAVVAAVAGADEMALLADEGPGNDAPHFIGADADFAARNVADTVQLFQRNDVVVSGNLEYAVCRRIDDRLLRAEMVRPEALDDFRAGSDFIADIAVPCLGSKQLHQFFREPVRKGWKRVVYRISHEFPMAARRILPGRNFFHEAVCADDLRRNAVNMSDLSQAKTAQVRHGQRHGRVDMAVRIGPGVAEFGRIRRIASSYAVHYDDDNPIEFHGSSLLAAYACGYIPKYLRDFSKAAIVLASTILLSAISSSTSCGV